MKKLIIITIIGGLFYSCSNSTPKTGTDTGQGQQNAMEITNDMESAMAIVPSWINEKTIIAMKYPAAHSGKYACITNDTIQYGYTYNELIKNINTGLPKKVTVNGWVYTTAANPNLGIVLDVSQDNKLYDWKSFSLADTLTETGKWIEFNAQFYFDKPVNPEQSIKIYAWNQSKKTIYFDDFKLRFDY